MDHNSDQGAMNMGNIQTKEVLASNYRFAAEFPPAILHNESTYTLTITDQTTKKTALKAEVWFETSYNGSGTGKIVSEKIEPGKSGAYVYSYALHSDSAVIAAFRIVSVNNEPLPVPIEISAKQQAMSRHSGHDSGSGFRVTPYMIGGVIVMTVMMRFILR
ncbi:MAG: hypothetical protein HYV28_09915 [Ignavibacteriales bacterium]|nr:hypothetical protein [Ignavibacteriales bacterium]